MFYTSNDGIVTVPAVVFGHGSLTHAHVLPEVTTHFETPHELVIGKLVPILGWLAEQGIAYRLRVVGTNTRISGHLVNCLTPAIDLDNEEDVLLAKMRWS